MSGFDYGQGLPDYGDGVHEHIWEVTSSFAQRRSVAGLEALREMLSPGGYFEGFDWQMLYDNSLFRGQATEGWLRQALEQTILGHGLWVLMGLEEHEGAIDDMEAELEARHDIALDYYMGEDYE